MTGKILKNVVIGILGLVAVSLMTKGGFYMVVGFLLIALLLFKNYLDGKTKKVGLIAKVLIKPTFYLAYLNEKHRKLSGRF